MALPAKTIINITDASLKWFAITGLALAIFIFSPITIKYVHTPSIKTGFYLSIALPLSPNIKLGDFVSFRYVAPKWAEGRYFNTGDSLSKQVVAIPGMYLDTRGLTSFVCQSPRICQEVGAILEKDSLNRPVSHVKWQMAPVPPDQFFLSGTNHLRSFDSRYYGLVPYTRITAKLYPILTF